MRLNYIMTAWIKFVLATYGIRVFRIYFELGGEFPKIKVIGYRQTYFKAKKLYFGYETSLSSKRAHNEASDVVPSLGVNGAPFCAPFVSLVKHPRSLKLKRIRRLKKLDRSNFRGGRNSPVVGAFDSGDRSLGRFQALELAQLGWHTQLPFPSGYAFDQFEDLRAGGEIDPQWGDLHGEEYRDFLLLRALANARFWEMRSGGVDIFFSNIVVASLILRPHGLEGSRAFDVRGGLKAAAFVAASIREELLPAASLTAAGAIESIVEIARHRQRNIKKNSISGLRARHPLNPLFEKS